VLKNDQTLEQSRSDFQPNFHSYTRVKPTPFSQVTKFYANTYVNWGHYKLSATLSLTVTDFRRLLRFCTFYSFGKLGTFIWLRLHWQRPTLLENANLKPPNYLHINSLWKWRFCSISIQWRYLLERKLPG